MFQALMGRLERWRPAAAPYVLGLTGSVASGKSHLAMRVAAALGGQVEVVSTDGFLLPNAELERRGLLSRKGFPESYDIAALKGAITALRQGPTEIPVHSHITYDIDPALTRRIEPPDVLILEGLSLDVVRRPVAGDPPLLDALIYLDAAEADLERWFLARFLGFWAAAEHDKRSFYARFRSLDRAGAEQFAAMVWTSINLPNLREHIVAAREVADVVVLKSGDHQIVEVR